MKEPRLTDKNAIGLTGEFYALAQLTQRGFVASLTLGHTKGVDVLVSLPDSDAMVRLEVKTTDGSRPSRERLFGEQPFIAWSMSEKHETIRDPKLYYCFVALRGESELPRFFIVPSAFVADYVAGQHRFWLSTRTKEVSPTPMRRFRISADDPYGFENDWPLLLDRQRAAATRIAEPWWTEPVAPA